MSRRSFAALLVLALAATCRAAEPLVVHEWGTFTSLQDEHGVALGRINTDDEPVPPFVHQLADSALFAPTIAFTTIDKGVPAGDPNVTMRLETPVIYFHLPKGQTAPMSLDVHVAFRGGWLTQFFPNAHAFVQDADSAKPLPPLNAASVGQLEWNALTLNSAQGVIPQTTDRVWTSPRAVDSAPVTAAAEREHFLFYRGVGHLDAPIRVVRNDKQLQITAVNDAKIGDTWLVDIHPDGAVAFRAIPAGATTTPADFAPQDFDPANLATLRAALHKSLVAGGLFTDEADALLNTWERSYFQNPGQRIFFIVPQTWTDSVLPLTLSVPAKITRVMVGRVEIITPQQRALLTAMTKITDTAGLKEAAAAMANLHKDPAKAAAYNALAGGHGNPADLGVPVPAAYADFLALGRFRTALVLNSPRAATDAWATLLTPSPLPAP